MPKVLFVIRQIGPYHHDRSQALALDGIDVLVIETMPEDHTYSWETKFKGAKYQRLNLPKSLGSIQRLLHHNAVFICGWYDAAMLKVLFVSLFCRCKRIIISDSRKADATRKWYKEIIKKMILKFYDAALIAGSESSAYLRELGFKNAIKQPWDVIDESKWKPEKPVEKENYWIFPARFIPEKNHLGFFNKLLKEFGAEKFPLLYCIGDGPLLEVCKNWVEEQHLNEKIIFFGFLQQEKLIPLMQKAKLCVLPSKKDTWGLVVNEALAANTAVLVSKNCGAVELIDEGVNGFILDDEVSIQKEFELNADMIFIKSNFKMTDFVKAVNLLRR